MLKRTVIPSNIADIFLLFGKINSIKCRYRKRRGFVSQKTLFFIT